MKRSEIIGLVIGGSLVLALNLGAYPPAVGILGNSKDCMSCHVDNGPWKDDGIVIIDIVDKQTKQSLRQPDGTFLIEAKRGEQKTVLTVIGSMRQGQSETPTRNAWIYVDPEMIGTSALSSFAPGWNINLPMACRVVGDKWDESTDADYTVLPMSVRPTDAAQDGFVVLQVMLTKGASVKGKAKEGLIGNYFERQVTLRVVE
jgi:hypothetical protein